MGANREVATPAFDSTAARQRYERAYKKLSTSSASLTCSQFADEFLGLEAELDAGMIEVKTAMLTSGLFSSDDEQALGTWIYRQHARLAQVGARAVQACLKDEKQDLSRTMRLLALTFLHSGEAVKWELMVGRGDRREYKLGNALMMMAIEKGRQRETGELVVDGIRRWSSIEQLFLRVHFLDRFTSGSLTRQQIEVLDAWLWEWAPSIAATSRYPGGVVMRVDLDSDQGMRYGRRKGDGPSLYLPLAPLEERRKTVIKELHRGRIVPAKGRAANIRVESHVAVLLSLRTMFAGGGSDGSPRAARQATAPTNVDVVLGLAEIVKALAGAKPVSSGSIPPLDLAPKASSARQDNYESVYDKTRRVMILKNASSTGFLLEASAKDAGAIGLLDLVGLRMGEDQPLILARVVRRVNELGHGIQLGMQVMSDTAWPMRVATLKSADDKVEDFIFVPGPDSSGRFDSFAVPYSAVRGDARYRVTAGGEEFTLVFNRMRRNGRGWALAGFEIVGRHPVKT